MKKIKNVKQAYQSLTIFPCHSMNLPKTACMDDLPLYSVPVCFYNDHWTLLFHELTKDSLHDLPMYSIPVYSYGPWTLLFHELTKDSLHDLPLCSVPVCLGQDGRILLFHDSTAAGLAQLVYHEALEVLV